MIQLSFHMMMTLIMHFIIIWIVYLDGFDINC